jgi:hypothetical protein
VYDGQIVFDDDVIFKIKTSCFKWVMIFIFLISSALIYHFVK